MGLCVGYVQGPGLLVSTLQQGSAISATDGSYAQKQGPNVSKVGWVIACQKSGKMLKGLFYEFSSDASSYRGELLGLVALHQKYKTR